MNANLNAYNRARLTSGGNEQYLLLLYEGAIRFSEEAVAAIEQGHRATKARKLGRVGAIIDALQAALDPEAAPELAERLAGLYEYMLLRILRGNVHDDVDAINEVIRLLKTLYEGWSEAVGTLREAAKAELDTASETPPRLATSVAG